MPYVKTSSRTTRSGVVRHLQLAHNEWDSDTQRSRTRVLYNFGREDELDREGIQRLVTSLSRLLEPGAALEATARALFALVANRALAPSSKLAAAEWVAGDVHIDGLEQVSDDACYRAMDELHAMEGDFGKKVYDNLAHLLNLEVDLLFFDYPANRVRDLALAA